MQVVSFLIFPENRLWHFMAIVSLGAYFVDKIRQLLKIFITPESGKGQNDRSVGYLLDHPRLLS